MSIKAIETVYNGYKFRSRLEARWAVFFDALRIKWEYEVEGFDLGEDGWYLPDFWLPDHKVWFEVKGDDPTDLEMKKCERLFWGKDWPVVLASGQLDYNKKFYMWVCDVKDSGSGGLIQFHPDNGVIRTGWNSCQWAVCYKCLTIDLFLGEYDRRHWFTANFNDFKMCQCEDGQQDPNNELIMMAYTIARQARFEHGQNGFAR